MAACPFAVSPSDRRIECLVDSRALVARLFAPCTEPHTSLGDTSPPLCEVGRRWVPLACSGGTAKARAQAGTVLTAHVIRFASAYPCTVQCQWSPEKYEEGKGRVWLL